MSRLTAPPPRAAGFTLVEVLVAMMIMAIIAVMSWQGVDGIVRARNASRYRLEQVLRLNTVLAQWEQDLANLQESPAVPGFAFDGGTVRITAPRRQGAAGRHLDAAAGPRGRDGGGSWLRWAGPAVTTGSELQETWMRTFQFQGNEPGQLRTLKGLVQWQVYCIYQNTGAGIANCQSSGNTQQQQQARPRRRAKPAASAAPAADAACAPRPARRRAAGAGVQRRAQRHADQGRGARTMTTRPSLRQRGAALAHRR
jgi:general secretion pathway protein J